MTTSPAVPAPVAASERDARMAWWREARFGLFIHYGLYSLAAGAWKGRQGTSYGEWLMANLAIPAAEYRTLAEQFTAERFDAEAIAQLAVDTGMGYVVLTAKHHEGFALFRSAASSFTSVDGAPCGRDLVGELAAACARRGLRFGVYYSQSQDWTHRGGNGNAWDPAQQGDYDAYLREVAVPQVRELLTRYGDIAVLWYDTPRHMTPERCAGFLEAHRLQSRLIVNDRLAARDFTRPADATAGDTETPEQFIPANGYPGRDWETCMTLNDSWGYKAADTNWKSPVTLVRMLTDIASKGGNYLLNIGPRGDGSIVPENLATFAVIGAWMKRHGEAIRGTQGSPFPRRLPWGRVTRRVAADGSVTLYLHLWERPASGRLLLPGLRSVPARGAVLGGTQAVASAAVADGLEVLLPETLDGTPIPVLALTFAGPLVLDPPRSLADATGRITLSPEDADLSGPDDAKPVVSGFGDSAVIRRLRRNTWRVTFSFPLEKPGVYAIQAEIGASAYNRIVCAASGPQGLSITSSVWAVAADADTLLPHELGIMRLAAGTVSLDLRAEMTDERTLAIGRLHLVPVG